VGEGETEGEGDGAGDGKVPSPPLHWQVPWTAARASEKALAVAEATAVATAVVLADAVPPVFNINIIVRNRVLLMAAQTKNGHSYSRISGKAHIPILVQFGVNKKGPESEGRTWIFMLRHQQLKKIPKEACICAHFHPL
jgi:hypothetical protein